MANKLKLILLLLFFVSKTNAQCDGNYGSIIISEVYFDTQYNEQIGAKYHNFGEYIELFNSSNTPINLQGWKIKDNHTEFTFSNNEIINPGGIKIITYNGFYARGSSFQPGEASAIGGVQKFIELFPEATGQEQNIILQNKMVLDNDVDKVSLYNPLGKLINEISYVNGDGANNYIVTSPLDFMQIQNYTVNVIPHIKNFGTKYATPFNYPIGNVPKLDAWGNIVFQNDDGIHPVLIPHLEFKQSIYLTMANNGYYSNHTALDYQVATATPFLIPYTIQLNEVDPLLLFAPNISNAFNSSESISYNIKTGSIDGQSKSYFDDLGKPTVSVSKDFVTNIVWGTEAVYDSFGRKWKESFPANSCFGMDKINFLSNPNTKITFLDRYYNDNNTDEPYQATAQQPYSEINYDKLNPGGVVNVIGGNQIETSPGVLEWKTGRSYTVPAEQEMYYVYGYGYYDGTVALGKEEVITKFYKSVGVDANGNENVSFSDGEGKILATARSGGTVSYPVISTIGTQGFVDVHIPAGVTAPITLLGGASLYDVYDLTANTGVITTAPLTAGRAYRIVAKTYPTTDPLTYVTNATGGGITTSPNALGVSYSVNYYDFAVNIYNKTGQLMKTVQPNGFAQAFPTSITMTAAPAYMPLTLTNFSSIYTYDNLGQVVASSSSDEGTSQFAYRQDGQIRYSQSALQLPLNKVSYTNYDSYARPIESGVITGTTGIWASAKSLVDSATMVAGTSSEQTVTVYDEVTTTNPSSIQIPATRTLSAVLTTSGLTPAQVALYTQKNLAGNVAVTFTRPTATTPITAITWYSYDIYGRAEWVVQYNDGIGAKTIDYEYDYQGNVKKVIFQKYKSAELFAHEYTYDANSVLLTANTSTSNLLGTFINQAQYSYYKTGELKRTYLMQAQQGLDYVYTLGGALKSINHPSLTALNDPGRDTNDLFGITLDYYKDDYTRAGTNITSYSNVSGFNKDDYNGNIKGITWANKTLDVPNPTALTSPSNPATKKTYLYNYNRNNWLTNAAFGSISNTLPNTINTTSNFKEGNLTYDANGNIQKLLRTNNLGVTEDNLTYNYTNAGKNQLNSVDDTAVTASSLKDIKDQNPNNYVYDAVGQMIKNIQEDLTYLYNTQGLVIEVQRTSTVKPLVKFFYNERGQRIKKESYNSTGNGVLQSTTYYILDLSGNAMADYYQLASGAITQTELPIYGASRLGVYYRNSGAMSYQLTDHLGNVRAVVTKQGSAVNMSSYADYYPFGEQLPGRNSMSGYRYAFQGQELDPETGMEAFQLRLWDGRIGRWLSPDPYGQYDSPYLGMGNNPIGRIDPDGGYTSKFWANWHNFWSGGNGTVFQSEKNGDWGIRTVTGNGSSISDGINISTTFGGKRYGGNEIRAYEPNLFGKLENQLQNGNPIVTFFPKIAYGIVDDAYVYGTRNFTKDSSARHLNDMGADPQEVIGAGLNTIMLITPSPIKGSLFGAKYSVAPLSLLSKFNVATFGSTFKGTFLTKLAPATRGQIITMSNKVTTFFTSRGMFITYNKSLSKKINED